MAFKLKKQVKHTDAKWFEFDEESKLLIASIDNPEYQVALGRLRREMARNDAQFQMGEAGVIEGEKTEMESIGRLMARYLVKGWSGVLDDNENPLEFTPENAERLLVSDIAAYLFVLNSAQKYSTELRLELEETVGKPSSDSAGKKSSGAKTPKSAGKSTDA